MKKEKRKQWERIVEEKKRLEKNLKIFFDSENEGIAPALLSGLNEWTRFDDVRGFLNAVDMEKMEIEDLSDYIYIPIFPYIKLDTRLNKSIGMAILYTYINCKIYDERESYKGIPDTLMKEITDFKDLLEEFLFS